MYVAKIKHCLFLQSVFYSFQEFQVITSSSSRRKKGKALSTTGKQRRPTGFTVRNWSRFLFSLDQGFSSPFGEAID